MEATSFFEQPKPPPMTTAVTRIIRVHFMLGLLPAKAGIMG